MYKKSLLSVEINTDLFELILASFNDYVEVKDNLTEYKLGYKDKKKIYINKEATEFICLASYLLYINDDYTEEISETIAKSESWRQVVCRVRNEQVELINKDFTGASCVAYMNKLLSEYYSKEEIEYELYNHEAEYDQNLAQFHNSYNHEQGKIIKYENCVKYDIHKAHLSALIEIFPKAKDRLLRLGEQAKVNKKFKKVANYYVGMLAHPKVGEKFAKHLKTYNWIVQRTTRLLKQRIDDIVDVFNSEIVYGNTDSICVSNPSRIIENSEEIGEFKIEYTGTVYSYRGSNYIVYQFGDELKGNLPLKLRNKVDLSQGKVVSFDRVKVDRHYEYRNYKELDLCQQN